MLILLITEIALSRDCRLYIVYTLLEIDEGWSIRLLLGCMPKPRWHQGSIPHWNSSGSCCFQEGYFSILLFSASAEWRVYILQSREPLHQIGRHQKRTALLSKGFIWLWWRKALWRVSISIGEYRHFSNFRFQTQYSCNMKREDTFQEWYIAKKRAFKPTLACFHSRMWFRGSRGPWAMLFQQMFAMLHLKIVI